MTTRGAFLGGVAAFALGARGAPAAALSKGDELTQGALFGSLPVPGGRMWTRLIMGAGAKYQKQIGLGSEAAAGGGTRLFYELEVGSPGGSCNPNSLRKAYLRSARFGSLFDTYSLVSNIGRAANLVFRYGDVTSAAHGSANDVSLRLLDLPTLYDPRPMTISSVARELRHQASRDVETTRITAEYGASGARRHALRRIDLWHHPSFPFGVVRYRAIFDNLEPFELEAYSFGNDYKTDLPLSLDKVRKLTLNDQYGSIPSD